MSRLSKLLWIPYLFPHCIVIALISELIAGNSNARAQVAYALLIAAVFDLVLGSRSNWILWHVVSRVPGDIFARTLILRSFAFIMLFFTVLVLTHVRSQTALEFLILVIPGAMFTAALSLAAAHELLHAEKRVDQWLAIALLVLCSCPFFPVEHISGHHRNVGTPADPATSRFGESFYRFYLRYAIGCFLDAWTVGAAQARGTSTAIGKTVWNRFWHLLVLCGGGWLLSFIIGGTGGLAYMFMLAVSANMFLGLTNYIQHYGLVRRRTSEGVLEEVSLDHSWSSFNPLSNWLLFNLPVHGPHHVPEGNGRAVACSPMAGPVLPGSYLLLLWLPLIPSLWRHMIHGNIVSPAERGT